MGCACVGTARARSPGLEHDSGNRSAIGRHHPPRWWLHVCHERSSPGFHRRQFRAFALDTWPLRTTTDLLDVPHAFGQNGVLTPNASIRAAADCHHSVSSEQLAGLHQTRLLAAFLELADEPDPELVVSPTGARFEWPLQEYAERRCLRDPAIHASATAIRPGNRTSFTAVGWEHLYPTDPHSFHAAVNGGG